MSTRVMSECWGMQMPPTQKAVLISLADNANDQGVCWPSIGTICERTCLAERTVRKAIRWLEQVRLLTVDISAMKSNRYTLTLAKYKAEAAEPAVTTGAPRAGGTTCPGAPRAGEGGTTCPQTVIEPNTEIPPSPPLQAKGGDPDLFADANSNPKPKKPARPDTAVALGTWLAACKAVGEQPIPEADAVFAYAERVGIGRELLELHWGVFKARRSRAGKRQRDWRQTFRNSVEGNWYGLWWMPPGGGAAELTSKGRQAQADQRTAALATPTAGASSP